MCGERTRQFRAMWRLAAQFTVGRALRAIHKGKRDGVCVASLTFPRGRGERWLKRPISRATSARGSA
eukprot:7164729-Lingulodinium_polyedra.AAC.1